GAPGSATRLAALPGSATRFAAFRDSAVRGLPRQPRRAAPRHRDVWPISAFIQDAVRPAWYRSFFSRSPYRQSTNHIGAPLDQPAALHSRGAGSQGTVPRRAEAEGGDRVRPGDVGVAADVAERLDRVATQAMLPRRRGGEVALEPA